MTRGVHLEKMNRRDSSPMKRWHVAPRLTHIQGSDAKSSLPLRRPIWMRGQLMCNENCSKSFLVHRHRPKKRQEEGRSSSKFNLVRPSVLKGRTRLLHYEHVSTRCERKRTIASQVQSLWNANLNNLTSTVVMEVTSEPLGFLNNRNCYQTSNRSPHAI